MELVVTNEEGVGSVSWWSLPGSANRDELVMACRNAGLNTKFIPPLPTAETCLQRALEDVFKDRNTLVKKTKNGFAVLPKGTDENGNPEFKTNVTASLLAQRCNFPDLDIGGCSAHYQEAIREAYRFNQERLAQQELSAMMVNLVRSLDGVGLHDKGRMYFIPSTQVGNWRQYTAAIGYVCELKTYNLPTMKVEEAVEVLGNSVKREISDSIASINADIQAWVKEEQDANNNNTSLRKIRTDALNSREAELNRLISLAETYQKVLGNNLTALKDAAEEAHSALMEAYIARM